MIVFVTHEQHRYTLADVAAKAPVKVRVATYAEMFKQPMLPRAAYVFTDLDRLSPVDLAHAANSFRMLRRSGLPAYNDPARFLGRFGLLRRLHRARINGFNAYRADALEKPKRFPVFVRSEGEHVAPLSRQLKSQDALDAFLEKTVAEGNPISNLVIIEYSAEPVRPGLYRKLAVFRVGERMVGFTCVHDTQWLVKYGKPGIAPEELYEDEFRLVSENPYGEAMRRVFDLAGLDYGRVDFGLVGGKPQIYEINSNPDIHLDPKSNGFARRDDSNAVFKRNFLDALGEIDFE